MRCNILSCFPFYLFSHLFPLFLPFQVLWRMGERTDGNQRKKVLTYKHVSLNARVSGYLDLKLRNLSPFGLKILKIYRKYAKRGQIVNLKSKITSETRTFKGTCYSTKKSCFDRGETLPKIPTKQQNLRNIR